MATDRGRAGAAQDEWMTIDEISVELKIPPATLYVWKGKGDFPRWMRVGKHIRVRRIDFDEWVEAKLVD
ncbi:helix-turn-helix domain-containing protein [Cryptosporangium sp. NPDC051539]|uniref:helix-turn-helix domain-containing protein n=1 Tax=Cryptosporangium sp. NPDC051539 TaxID=3363962 RepID=UPI0037B52799